MPLDSSKPSNYELNLSTALAEQTIKAGTMTIFTRDAIEVAEEIFKTLKAKGLIGYSDQKETAVITALSGLLVQAGFPERDVLTKHITILLSDIRGFSEISENHPPRQVVALLNRYFDCMGEIISHYIGPHR